MHNWILVDIVEEFTGNSLEDIWDKLMGDYSDFIEPERFVEHKYILGCYSCEQTRIVREDTFNKMVKLGLIEE